MRVWGGLWGVGAGFLDFRFQNGRAAALQKDEKSSFAKGPSGQERKLDERERMVRKKIGELIQRMKAASERRRRERGLLAMGAAWEGRFKPLERLLDSQKPLEMIRSHGGWRAADRALWEVRVGNLPPQFGGKLARGHIAEPWEKNGSLDPIEAFAGLCLCDDPDETLRRHPRARENLEKAAREAARLDSGVELGRALLFAGKVGARMATLLFGEMDKQGLGPEATRAAGEALGALAASAEAIGGVIRLEHPIAAIPELLLRASRAEDVARGRRGVMAIPNADSLFRKREFALETLRALPKEKWPLIAAAFGGGEGWDSARKSLELEAALPESESERGRGGRGWL